MSEEESLYLSLRPFCGGAMTCEINCTVSSVSPIGNLNLPAVLAPALADSCVVDAKVYLYSIIDSCLCAEVKLFKFADSNLIHCSIAFKLLFYRFVIAKVQLLFETCKQITNYLLAIFNSITSFNKLILASI